MPSPRATAFHEAGHVVAADAVGWRILSATVVREGRFPGTTRWVRADERKAAPAERALVYVSGSVAEATACRTPLAEAIGEATDPDSDRVGLTIALDERLQALGMAGDAEMRRRLESRTFDRAGVLIRRLWPRIVRLAEALLVEKTLDEKTLRRLLTSR